MGASSFRRRIEAGSLLFAIYLVLQTIVVVAHEFAHSTTAWLLGYTSTPFTVIWGDPITMKGWDEGVPYDRLFPAPGVFAESMIGGMPLFLHMVLLILGLSLLFRLGRTLGPFAFFALYILVVINLAEFVAYILMRPFIPTGDTGRFNEGLAISPWPLFLTGTAFLLLALGLLSRTIGRMIDLKTDGSLLEHRAITWPAGFIIFLWGSGIRMITLYPDPQWKTGLIGVAGFAIWIAVDAYRTKPGAV